MKLPLPQEKYQVYETVLSMRWGDMDAFAHLNNTLYVRYFEEARVRWLVEMRNSMQEGGTGPVVANVFTNFYRQLEYPAQLRVRLFVNGVGRSSCDMWMTIEHDGQPDIVVADGGCTMVWVDYAAGKAVALPDWVRDSVLAVLPPQP